MDLQEEKIVNYRKKTITVNIFETTIKCNKLENFDKINNFEIERNFKSYKRVTS